MSHAKLWHNIGIAAALTIAALKNMDWTTAKVRTGAGQPTYAGVRPNSVLHLPAVKPEASTIGFVSNDGSVVERPLADVRTCGDCLLSVAEGSSSIELALPGFEGKL